MLLVRRQRRLGDFGHPAARGRQDRIIEIIWTFSEHQRVAG